MSAALQSGAARERIADIARVANRAGYIWLSRRWPFDDAALDAVNALGIVTRPPRGRLTLTDVELLDRARSSGRRAVRRLRALATCPAMDHHQRAEVADIADALDAVLR
jgi:hypothetical protein